MLDKTNLIDFSNANPRNSNLMNELAFAGEGIAEGFLECFNVERNRALEKYKNQLHVIETKEDKGQSRYYIGGFKDGKLNRFTPFKKTKDNLIKQFKKRTKRYYNNKKHI